MFLGVPVRKKDGILDLRLGFVVFSASSYGTFLNAWASCTLGVYCCILQTFLGTYTAVTTHRDAHVNTNLFIMSIRGEFV